MERRFGTDARIEYLDTSLDAVRQERAEIIEAIREQGLNYPVTVVDGRLCCEGAVSHPAIMRAVEALRPERSRP